MLEALDVLRAAGDDYGVANTLDTVGHARLHLGQAHEAIDCYRRSHELFHTLGDGFPAADVLFHLGEAYEAIGAADEARQAWERALDILTELGHSLAGRVRERLLG